MTSRAGEWRLRLLLATFSTALALLLAEGAARLLLRPSTPGPAAGTPISELSATLGWKTRALGSQRLRREDFEVTVSINSKGLRGPEIAYEAAPGIRRLAILGDSFAHGYYAEEPETLRGRLGKELHDCRVEVVNGGSPGYSTDQERLYFSEEIRKYRPAEVVLLVYYNDLLFNIENQGTANRPKPIFVEQGGALVLIPPPSSAEGAPVSAAVADPKAAPLFHHSALWAFASARLQRTRPDWSRALSEHGLAPGLSVSPPAEFLPFGPKDSREQARVEEMWRRTGLILGDFRDEVRKGGAGFSVFYVPARFEVNDAAWAFVQRRYERARPWRREAVENRLASLLGTLEIPFVEATESFRAAERSTAPAYLEVDGHWNARGNAIAFDVLAPMMRRAFGCVT